MPRHPARPVGLWLLAATMLLPEELLACAVCFGEPNSQMSKAADAGVLTLLFIVLAVLAGVAAFFVHVARRSAELEAGSTVSLPSSNQNHA